MAIQKRGLTACRELMVQCHEAADEGRWKRLDHSRNEYMEAFEQLKSEIEQTGMDDEDRSMLRSLEREQRHLIYLIRRRQEYIREQLDVLVDVRRRLLRTRDIAQSIKEGRA